MTTKDAEFFAIRRPMEGQNLLGIEVGNLVSRCAIDGLNPDVIHAVLFHRIGNGFSIRE